jgi:NADH-quinone oxidoreductase subunit L
MGGLKHLMPRTRVTFLIATLAISGAPLLSGFFSKDEILVGAFASHSYWVYGVLLFAAGVTTFYMFRLYTLVFSGKFRGTAEQKKAVHESPASMTIPLMVLAVLSIVGGWIGIPKFIGEAIAGRDINFLHHWLAPSLTVPHGAHDTHLAVSTELMMMGAAVAIFFIAMVWARSVYAQPFRTAESLKRAFGSLYTTTRNLFWVDELYKFVVIRPFYWLSRFFAGIDRWVVDGLVNLVGIGAGIFGQVLKLFQTGVVRNYALLVLIGVVAILAFVTR